MTLCMFKSLCYNICHTKYFGFLYFIFIFWRKNKICVWVFIYFCAKKKGCINILSVHLFILFFYIVFHKYFILYLFFLLLWWDLFYIFFFTTLYNLMFLFPFSFSISFNFVDLFSLVQSSCFSLFFLFFFLIFLLQNFIAPA